MRRAIGRASRRIAIVTLLLFGLTVAVPAGAVPADNWPVSWLWSWTATRPLWSAAAAALGAPAMAGPAPFTGDHHVPADATDADGGAGRAADQVAGTLPPYQPHDPAVPTTPTGVAEPGFDAATSRRDASEATARTDVYDNADGSTTVRTYSRPVNYRAGDGSWRPIDTGLVRRADGRLHMRANSLQVSVADATGDTDLGVLALPGGQRVAYELSGAADVDAEVDGNTATYRGILPHTDLELITFDAGLKETLILHSPQAQSTWTFPLNLTGLTPRLTAEGWVELVDSGGTPRAWFPRGFMEDSNVHPQSGAPAQSPDVDFAIVELPDGGQALQVTADRAWLDDPARVYPVRVDPTATTGTTGDVYVDSDTLTTNHNGDNLPVGTYDGGGVKARSFIHFDEFDDDGFLGKRITAANLKLYLTWTYSCTEHRAFNVHRVNQAWTVANLSTASHPGPDISAPIGSLTVTNNYPSCQNSDGVRSIGKWVTVPLNVATFNDWSTGGVNEGLALTASETDSDGWKRFTSANYGGGAYKPYVELTYTNNVAPQVNVRYPANNAVTPTLTPELLVRAKDPDNWPNKGFTYNYVVYDATGTTTVANSGWVASPSWRVPTGTLAWNKTYLYTVRVYDKAGYSAVYPAYAFTTGVPQPTLASNLSQNAGKGYDPGIGNYTTSATDATVATVGPSLTITRNYNSLDTRRTSAFGTGWSSLLDVRATAVPDAAGSVQSVLVTYPTGQDIAFGRNANGTFTAPSGRFATFTETRSGSTLIGYTLTDKDASVYTFGQSAGGGVFRLTAVTDANGRTLTIEYTNGLASRVVSAAGRSLWLTWSTPAGSAHPHVATVATDPAQPGIPASAETWQYGYGPDDTLVQVCPPTGPSACHGYQHTSISAYANTVLDTGPYSYWPLSEPSGASVARSAVLANAGIDNARYAAVNLGQPATRPGSTATVAAFDGTSSYLQLPGDLVADGQYQTVSMWFRTTAVNGVLFGYSAAPVTAGTTPTTYVPALYVGSDGKLRGQFWQGNAAAAITTAAPVNDGNWHHVALAGAGSTQTLYLDGVAQGSLGGIIMQLPDNADNIHVGAGFIGGNWPGHQNSGVSPAAASYFSGSISDVAFHNQALPAATVAALHTAGTRTHPVLSQVTRPSGGVTAQVTYQGSTGRVATVTDENGGVWTMGTPTVAGSADVYAASVLGAKPADYWRFGEVSATEAVNQVDGGVATFNQVTLGAAGPFAGATAASFNGSDSYVELPPERIVGTGPASVSMWFKMPTASTAGSILYSFQTNSITSGVAGGERIPALYVGADGKLRGKWCWCLGTNPPITTAGSVRDGSWHHVALTLSGSTQRMYLDGDLVGTLNLAGQATTAAHAYLGAGLTPGTWPSLSGSVSYFPGQIAEAAFFTSELSQAQVTAHYAASQQTAPVAITMISGVATAIPMPVSQIAVTGPTGETVSYSYDLVNGGRPVAQTDALGNVTKFGYDVGGYSSLVYDPRGVWSQTFQDVRGNTKQSVSCQDQSANKCSSVYYTYYPDATTTTLTPDARNDLLLTVRDGRSTSETDNTYRTSYAYDTRGNQTTITDPLGRVTTTGYTDGTSTPAYGGGIAPAGLPTRVTTPGGAVQTVEYYANGDLAQVTDPGGKVTRFTYDGLGRTLTETELSDTFPAGLTTTYTYDAAGRVATETAPAVTNRVTGAVHTARTTYGYDADGNVLTETTADLTGGDSPRTEQHTYNQYGQQVTSTTPGGTVTTLGYDAYGRVVTETDHDGGVTTNEYDAEGNLLTTTVVGFTGDPDDPQPATDVLISAKSYDPAGRLAAETDPMGWTTEYTYTDNGLIAEVVRTDGTSSFVVESNEYDAAGNLVREVSDDGATVVTHTFDAAGRQTSTTVDPDGLKRTTHYGYDADDNVVTERQTDAGGATVGFSETLYDPAGEVIADTEYPSTALTPVARWRLDETTGGRAADSAGNNPGTVADGTWTTGHGGAAGFNGTSSVIETDSPAIDTGRSFTVTGWLYLADNGALRKAISAPGDQQDAFDLTYDQPTNRWRFRTIGVDVTNPTSTTVRSTSTPAVNTWTHLAGVYDAAAGTMTLYVNGTAQGSSAVARPFTARGPLVIGAGKWNGLRDNYWPGEISDVQAYQKALTPAEVAAVHGGTAPAADAHVVRESYRVDDNGEVVAVTDANSHTTYVTYDEDGNAVKTTAPAAYAQSVDSPSPVLANAVSWVGYNTFGEVTDTLDPSGNWSVTSYDADGRAVGEQLPAYTPPGSTTPITPEITHSYDASGQLASVTDPFGETTEYTYDQLGRLTKVVTPNDGTTRYTYNLAGDLLSTTDPTGAVATSTYDYLGRQVTSTDVVRQTGTNHTTTYSYGPGGRLAQVTGPTGVTTAATYNAVGQPLAVTDGAGNITRYAYDGAGRAVRTTLPDDTYTTTSYDLTGRVLATAVHNAAGTQLSVETTGYDRAGNVVAATDARGTTATFEYDATGALTRHTQPISGSDEIVTTFGYDLSGNRTRFTDGRGNVFWTGYNPWHLPEKQIEPSTTAHPSAADRTFSVAYDAAGRPVTQYLPGGVTISSEYDEMGQLLRQEGAGAEATTVDRVFDYDLGGRMTEFSGGGGTNTISYDDRDLPLSISGPVGNSSFTYNAAGQLASRQDAAGTTSYGYDTAGRLASLTNPTAGVAMGYTYNALSQVSQITYGGTGNRRQFSFDAQHRLTGDTLKTSGGTQIAAIGYGWDANDNLVSKTTTGFGGAAVTNTYSYDLADRLTSWNNGSATVVYAYDKSGNRVQNGSKLFSYDQRNRLLTADGTAYTYTARGTLATAGTVTTTTDAFGQVHSQQPAGGGPARTYDYDALGRAVRPGFAYTGAGNHLAADDGASYVRGPSGEVVAGTAGGTQRLMWTDLHTDVVGQFTATGASLSGAATYDPLGKVVASTGVIGSLGFQSEWTDAVTSRVNMHARWYNTDTGQFDTRDTASNGPVPDSIAANRYQYGDGTPLTTIDPTGHWGNPFKAAAKAVSKATSKVSSATRRAVSSVSSYSSAAYQKAKTVTKAAAKKVTTVAKKTVNQVKAKAAAVKTKVKKTYAKAKQAVKKKVNQAKKYVAQKAAKAKQKVKQTVAKVKQAAKKVAAKATRVVKKTVSVVKDAANATKKWVVEHKDTILEVAAIAGAVVAGLACTAVTAGVGAVACMVGAGALINLAKDVAQGDIHSVGDALGSLTTGAVMGLAGGAGGMIAAKIGTAVAAKAGSGITARLAGDAVENGVSDIISQAATTGRVDVKAAALGMVPGLNLIGRKGGGAGPARAPPGRGGSTAGPSASSGRGGSGPGCRTHSFAPDTRVLMADGTTRAIADINIGDQVVATDPVSGTSLPKPVTQLHRNTDRELTDVQVRTSDGTSTVVETTPNHPFWDEDRQAWVDAGDLTPGTQLRVAGHGEVTVVAVETRRDEREMRDLTVAHTHTYHVIAGDHPVLVHNNNASCDVPTLKGYAQQIREAGDHPAAVNQRVIAVGQDEAGNLVAGSSNGFDAGQAAAADALGIRRVPSRRGRHAEENLIADNDGSMWPLKRVGTDARTPCGPAEHNCARQLTDRGIEHG
ncbi:polymorphic toxin-type HINT domain-containing protein [Solwaraspora sp. WMMA2056]|uniref:LamG-like jellyroll fold domain-containing protein n=1 Tax=Solwaraspora sp. WMMA2056 TaxID=3015161 RepID=UPI00259B27E3|nr:LamG-like jellyroll fold domain-containing protein [Solwaraspora sp. WMMA2056]WJK43714.1 polymorphic toxin-type HINT domain-containing protein [Solwaraspora sp. WMMA2056]